jgi:hypothetical protein
VRRRRAPRSTFADFGDFVIAQKIMHAIRREDQHVARLHRHGPIVDFKVRIDAHRARKIFPLARDSNAMVSRELFDRAAPQQIDSRISSVKYVRGRRFQHEPRESGDHASIRQMVGRALAVQPAIDG